MRKGVPKACAALEQLIALRVVLVARKGAARLWDDTSEIVIVVKCGWGASATVGMVQYCAKGRAACGVCRQYGSRSMCGAVRAAQLGSVYRWGDVRAVWAACFALALYGSGLMHAGYVGFATLCYMGLGIAPTSGY